MDKEKQMENIRDELVKMKEKNPSFYNSSIKGVAKLYISEHPEIESDKDLQLMLNYAVAKIGKDKVDEIVRRHYSPYAQQYMSLLKGTQKEPSNQLNLLYMRLSGAIERASLAHEVYVLGRTKINKDVEFKNEEPDEETGKRKKHNTMSLELWDNDAKRIIPLFLVDDQIEPHSSLMPNKAYRMLVGSYDETKKRWYASKDPSIIPLDGDSFKLDQNELVKYLMDNYPMVKEPYDDVIEDIKSNPGKRYVFLGGYVKKPGYILLVPGEGSSEYTIISYYGASTRELVNDDGMLIMLGNFSKPKPKEGQAQLSDYVINADFVVDLTSSTEKKKAESTVAKPSSAKTEEEIKEELKGVL